MQELFESSVERTHPADLALVLLDFQQEVAAPHVPASVVTLLLTPLAWLRPLFGR
jgi:hypothetical protein